MWLERGKSKKLPLLSASVNGIWKFVDRPIREVSFIHLEIDVYKQTTGASKYHQVGFEIPILDYNLDYVPILIQTWTFYLKISPEKTFVFEDIFLKTKDKSNHHDDCYSLEYAFKSFKEKITSQ